MPNPVGISAVNSDILTAFSEEAQNLNSNVEKKHTAPLGLGFGASSISRCSPDYLLMKLQIGVHEIYASEVASKAKDVEENLRLLRELNEKRNEEEKKKVLYVENASYWHTFQNIASYVGFASSTFVGLTACSNPFTGTIVAGCGAVGLINRVCADTGVWKSFASYFVSGEKEQEMISGKIDTTLSIGTTLGSLLSITQAGAILSKGTDLAKKIFQVGTGLFSGIANYKSARSKSEVDKSEADLISFQKDHVSLHSGIKQSSQQIDETAKKDQNIFNRVSSMIHSLIEALKSRRGK